MVTTTESVVSTSPPTAQEPRNRRARSAYPFWFYLPAGVIYAVLFIVPTLVSFFFSLTRWTLFDYQFIGFDNFVTFFQEPALVKGLQHTLVYAVITSGLKVVLGMLLAVLLTSQIVGRGFLRSAIFFPVLVSTIGVGLTFTALMDPAGLINSALDVFGISGPGWLTDPSYALLSSRWSTSGRASGWRPSSTWRASCRSRLSTSRRPGSTGRQPGTGSGTSSCRWHDPPRRP